MSNDLREHLKTRGNPCRYYNGFRFNRKDECAQGFDLRHLFYKKYGHDASGYLLKIPCNGSREPFCDCPGLDVKTDAEIAEAARKSESEADRFVAMLPKIQIIKSAMIEDGKENATFVCPNCLTEMLNVRCNIGGNEHVHAHCSECKWGFLE